MLRLAYLIPIIVPAVRLAWRLFTHPRVPRYLKALPIIALIYALFPIDALPDVLPVLGQIDDLLIAALLLAIFVWLSSRALSKAEVEKPGRTPGDPGVIEGRFRYVEPDDGADS